MSDQPIKPEQCEPCHELRENLKWSLFAVFRQMDYSLLSMTDEDLLIYCDKMVDDRKLRFSELVRVAKDQVQMWEDRLDPNRYRMTPEQREQITSYLENSRDRLAEVQRELEQV